MNKSVADVLTSDIIKSSVNEAVSDFGANRFAAAYTFKGELDMMNNLTKESEGSGYAINERCDG